MSVENKYNRFEGVINNIMNGTVKFFATADQITSLFA